MSEIKYEDIYYMLKDVAFDQEYPTEAYKKIAKEITKVETERDRYKAEMKYLAELLEDSNVTICKLCKRLNPQHENCTGCSDLKTRIAALAKIKEG